MGRISQILCIPIFPTASLESRDREAYRDVYARIQILTRVKEISLISQSILNRFPCNFTHIFSQACGDYPEVLAG